MGYLRSWTTCVLTVAACGYGLHDDVTTAGADATTGATTTVGGTSTSVGGTSTSVGGSTTSVGGSTTTPATSTGCDFICDPDGGSLFACDNFAQDCPEGQKCAAYDRDDDGAWESTQCVDVLGDGEHGDPCTAEGASGIDTCDAGVMCWYLDVEGQGTCVALCTGTLEQPHCEPPGTKCVITAMSPLNLCLHGCDPTVQDCSVDEVCVPDLMQGFRCEPDASGGMAPVGTPCALVNACSPGLYCADPEFAPFDTCQGAEGCCTAFCDLTEGDGPCQQLKADFVCVPWFEQGQAPPQWIHVGGCGVAS